MEIIFLVEYLAVRYFVIRVLILKPGGNVLGIFLPITQIYAEAFLWKNEALKPGLKGKFSY